MPELPLVGAQVALLGAAAFDTAVRQVNAQITQLSLAFTRLGSGFAAGGGGAGDAAKAIEAASTAAVNAVNKLAAAQSNAGTSSKLAAIAAERYAASLKATAEAAKGIGVAGFVPTTGTPPREAQAVSAAGAAAVAAAERLAAAQAATAAATVTATAATDAYADAQLALVVAEQKAAAVEADRIGAYTFDALTRRKAAQEEVAVAQARVTLTQGVANAEEAAAAAAATAEIEAQQDVLKAVTAVSAAEKAAAVATAQVRVEASAATSARLVAQEQAAATAEMAAFKEVEKASAELAAAEEAQAAQVAASHTAMITGIVAGAAVLAAVTIAAIGAAVKIGTAYGAEIAYIGAISEASAEQVGKLSDAQLELSRHSTQGAEQLALASEELVKAGFSIGQITDQTVKAVNDLVLASKGELSAAEAANLAQVSVAAFGSTVTDAANAATAATVRSAITYSGYATAIRQAGNAAANAGLTVAEFGAVVGSAGKTISSGTVIGTGLRQMFLRLANPTSEAAALIDKYGLSLYYANGAARPFRDVIEALSDRLSNEAVASGRATQEERDHALAVLFTARAYNVGVAIANEGVKTYDELTDAQQRLTTEDIANKTLAPTAAKMKELSNNVSALAIKFEQGLNPAIDRAVSGMLAFAQSLDANKVQAYGTEVGFLVDIFNQLGVIIAELVKDFVGGGPFGLIVGPLKSIGDALAKQVVGARNANAVRDYTAFIATLDIELAKGTITQAQHDKAVEETTKAYENAIPGLKKYGDALDSFIGPPTLQGPPTAVGGPKGTGVFDEEAAAEAEAAAKKVADATATVMKSTRDFNDDVAKLTQQTADDVRKLYITAYDDIDKAVKKNADDITKATEEASKQISDLQSQTAVKADQDARRKALTQRLEDEASANDARLKAEEDAHKREVEDAQKAEDEILAAKEDEKKAELDLEEKSRGDIRATEDLLYKESQDALKKNLEAQQATRRDARKREQDDEEQAFKDETAHAERVLAAGRTALEADLKHRQDLRAIDVKDSQDADQAKLKSTQDAREQDLKNQLDAEKSALDVQISLEDLLTKDTQDRAQAQYEYRQDIQRGVKESIAQARLQEKLGKISADTSAARSGIQQKQEDDKQKFDLELKQQQRLSDLQAQFDQENQRAREDVEKQNLALEEKTQGEIRTFRAETEQETYNLQQDRQAKSIALQRRHEDELSQIDQANQDARDKYADTLEQTALARSQKRATEDDTFKREQAQKLTVYKQGLDDQATAYKRGVEDIDNARKTQLEVDATAFKRDQEVERAKLEAQFEAEDLARKITNINDEKNKRIAAANEALVEEQIAIRKKLAQDVLDLRANLTEKLAEIRKQYIEKLQDLVDQTNGALAPLVNKVIAGIDIGLDGVRQSAADATTQLIETFKAEAAVQALVKQRASLPGYPTGAAPGALPPGVQNVPADQAPPNTLTRQYGGMVPGPYGSRQWILAHGGEQFMGIGGVGTALMAVRLAESMARHGVGGSSYVTNHYDYNVEANYGRVQAEGSVRADLSALVMLTRR